MFPLHGVSIMAPFNFKKGLRMLVAECKDCGKPYETFGLDIYLNDEDWEKIQPEKDGLLCANCIVKRASKIMGVIVIKMELDYRKGLGNDSRKE